jgi:hypothetical protein
LEITEISLGGAVALLILREVFGFLLNRRDSSALSERDIDTTAMSQKITDLWDWHNVRGADNVPVWYFRSSLDDAMDKLSDSIDKQTEVLQKVTFILDRLDGEVREHIHSK